MHSEPSTHPSSHPSSTQSNLAITVITVLLFVVLVLLVLTLVAATTQAQTSVPPTARQAQTVPVFAARLAHASPQHASRVNDPERLRASYKNAPGSRRSRGMPLDDNTLYSNGAINGTTDAWTINSGYVVSDSFTIPSSGGSVNGLIFGAWTFPGDVLQTVETSITSSEFGGTTYSDQVVSFTQSGCSGNQYGFNVCTETNSNFIGPNLAAGTYWLNLSNAVVNDGDPVYWDENSGPSMASENGVGTIPSEAFTIEGGNNCPPWGCPPPPTCDNVPSIHDFTGGTDGASPGGMVVDKAGNFYGTTGSGGVSGNGTAFKLFETASGWILDTLYSFVGGAGGSSPGEPILGPNGTLYGTASGTSGGVIFNLTPQPTVCATANCQWLENVLYQPSSPVSAIDAEGNLYGADPTGGANGQGAIFELSPAFGSWTKTILYSFTGGDDGYGPGAVQFGFDGNLYGRAKGGAFGYGVLFQLVSSPGGWTENTLVAFSVYMYDDYSYSDLIGDGSGKNFYFAYGSYRAQCFEFGGYCLDGDVGVLHYANGAWTADGVYRIEPGTWNSYVSIYSLSADSRGPYAAAFSIETDCIYGFCFLWNGVFKDNYGTCVAAGQLFDFSGSVITDEQGYPYGTSSSCGGHGYGEVWHTTGWPGYCPQQNGGNRPAGP